MQDRQLLGGFTLIELLVVIAIIGLLSTIVLASLNTARMKSRDARRLSDVKQLQLALAVYADANGGGYPLQLSKLSPQYISVEPTDPVSGAEYSYAALYPSGSGLGPACTSGSSYHLGAVLEDPTNQYLATDGDFPASGDPGGLTCSGSASDFNGASKSCNTLGGPEQCYDVEP
jgi:prepilin-type N-terminal cleavage/methylation domain-containing protein